MACPAIVRLVVRRTVTPLVAAAVVAAGLIAASFPASADPGTPGWYGLGFTNPAGPPVLAVDGAGDDYVAFALQQPSFPGYVVYVEQRVAGAGTELGDPVPVSAMNSGDSSLYPSIAADAAGDVIVAWYDGGVIYAATKPAGTTTFSDPVAISDPNWLADPFAGRQVTVRMDDAGDAIVVWPNTRNGVDFEHGDTLVGRMRPVGSSFAAASFGAQQQIYDPASDDNNLVSATAVAMGGGQAVITYTASAVARASTWAASSATPSGSTNLGGASYCPGSAHSIYCSGVTAATDADGDAVAAFESGDENSDDASVGVTTLLVAVASGGGWSGPTPVTAGLYGSGPTGPVAVAMSPNGHTAVAWDQTTGTTNTDVSDEVAVGDAPGSLGTPIAVDQPTSYLVTLGVDDQGTVLTTWTGSVPPSTLEASVLAAGSTTWQGPSEPGNQGSAASQPVQLTQGDGNTVLAFAQPVNNGVGGAAVVLDGFDATGPAISSLTVPTTAAAGSSVPMSVTVDDYAGVDPSDVSWDFGDGQTGTGFDPQHTYPAPGAYTVTVTALDAAGFATSASAPITVMGGTLRAGTPTITGTAKVGSKLTAHAGTWTSGTSFSYHWYASGKAITGASNATLVLAAPQYRKTITVKVTGSKSGYTSLSKTSKPTAKVAAGALSGAKPTITGQAKVGSTLTAHPGTWRPGGVKFSYRWYASGTSISRATRKSLALTRAMKGKKITVRVTGSEPGYRALTETSKATKPVS